MFVTRVECDVERKMMLNKEMLMKENRGWARSELEALTSSIQPWYARNRYIQSHEQDIDLRLQSSDQNSRTNDELS